MARPARAAGTVVRYDSMIATALSIDADTAAARATQWRQLLDIIAQGENAVSDDLRVAAFTRLVALQAEVPLPERRRSARQLAGRVRSVALAMVFANDEPSVAMPVLRTLTLNDGEWRQLIAKVSTVSRALLRNRRDLPESARRALASFGSSDFGLPSRVPPQDVVESTQIRALVERIEAFRSLATETARDTTAPFMAETFAFQCSADGLIDWVAGAPREPLIGTMLAEPGGSNGSGVDGQAAGAFRRRAPFRDARLIVPGESAAGGQWLIAGSPVFNPRDGRFAGYHGTARRPRPGEIAGPVARFGGTTLPIDSLRQLVHELRTPLNAVLGFAAMIDQQLLGPAAQSYRARAHAIVEDGQRLLDMVDDLDHAARPAVRMPDDEPVDARATVAQAVSGLGLATRVSLDPGSVVPVAVDPQAIARMVTRLVAPMVGLAGGTEIVRIAVGMIGGRPTIVVRRVDALAGATEARLFDRGGEGDISTADVRAFGLSFALRLVQNMARSAGGRLSVEPDAFVISLPGPAEPDSLPAGIPRE